LNGDLIFPVKLAVTDGSENTLVKNNIAYDNINKNRFRSLWTLYESNFLSTKEHSFQANWLLLVLRTRAKG